MYIPPYFKKKTRDFFRAIDVPENLTPLIDIDDDSEVEAEQAGLSQSSVNTIWRSFEDFYRTGMHPAMSVCLRKNGKVVLNRSIGYAKGVDPVEALESPVPMTVDTPICLYSASKAVMAMLVHKLAEEGYVNLLNPVAYYLPEFGRFGKDKISIFQMLSHRGGFPVIDADVPLDTVFDRDAVLELIYNTESLCPEGRVQAYHAITSGFIADELIRTTTGKTINEYLFEKFAEPMGMTNFSFGVSKDNKADVARNYVSGMRNGKLIGNVLEKALGVSIEEAALLSNSDDFMTSVIPSANLYTTAEEIGRFYQMLLDRGEYEGRQILKPETVDIAVKEAGKTRLDKGIFLPMRFSAGFMLGGKPAGMYGLDTHNAFGHLGFSNIFCWADPQRNISAAILTTGKPVLGSHILGLPKMMHAISSECLD
ncbi:Protein flp [BD1-7 clade bacterium]|uniref:Protein flp n=1 Tax=BD1-7 clade bacterium TaxID=2029982 RepID=A0A5S9PVM1_9GAMM|nr:Protein flp [BD1-7 clade bacterium]